MQKIRVLQGPASRFQQDTEVLHYARSDLTSRLPTKPTATCELNVIIPKTGSVESLAAARRFFLRQNDNSGSQSAMFIARHQVFSMKRWLQVVRMTTGSPAGDPVERL